MTPTATRGLRRSRLGRIAARASAKVSALTISPALAVRVVRRARQTPTGTNRAVPNVRRTCALGSRACEARVTETTSPSAVPSRTKSYTYVTAGLGL